MPLASPATEPKRHWLSLPLWCPAGAGGLAPLRHWLSLPLWYPAGGVAVLVARLPFTLALFLPPSPRPPSRREGGDSKFSYARGFAPCIPGAEPARHLQNLPSGCPEWGFAPCGAGMGGVPVPGGGMGACPLRHLLSLPRGRGPSQTPKFLSPGPPSPWLPALLVGNRLLPFSRRTVGTAPGDARGEAPCIK